MKSIKEFKEEQKKGAEEIREYRLEVRKHRESTDSDTMIRIPGRSIQKARNGGIITSLTAC